MTVQLSSLLLPLGLLELDPQGVVVRYAAPAEERSTALAKDIVGRDFFSEIVPAGRVAEFRARFRAFMEGGRSVEKFTARVPEDGQSLKVQIVMAHVSEKTAGVRRRLALVRIMPE